MAAESSTFPGTAARARPSARPAAAPVSLHDASMAAGDHHGDRPHVPVPGGPVDRFAQRVRLALADRQVAERLAEADVRAVLELRDVPDAALTLLLDRDPPMVVAGSPNDAAPTVRLTLDADDLDRMLADSTHLPMAILAGEVVFEGAVRKLLRVLPILRSAVADAEA